MKDVRPLLVTLSVTMVVPGCSRSEMVAMSAMKRFELISRPSASTMAELYGANNRRPGRKAWTMRACMHV